jgi:3-dehydroquinate dehydratase type I
MDFDKCVKTIEKVPVAEIRLDMTEFNMEQIDKIFRLPKKLIATVRPGKYSQEDQMAKLKAAIDAGAGYIDLEYEAPEAYKKELLDYAHQRNTDVIISYHNFEETPEPEELIKIIRDCFAQGADVAKTATMVKTNKDNAKIMSVCNEPGRKIAFGMGEMGTLTRVIAPFLGAEFTFASMDDGLATAPGQIPFSKIKALISAVEEIA